MHLDVAPSRINAPHSIGRIFWVAAATSFDLARGASD
jgi:hypothetical protein